jgi:hypothetical protein
MTCSGAYGSVALVDRRRRRETVGVVTSESALSSPPVGYRFPREVIAVAVRWYLRYGLSYRDVEELLAERGIEVDHVTVYRWVQTFTPVFIDAARPARHVTGDRWFVDETYVKVAGRWMYLYVRSISTARSSTCSSPRGATPRQHGHFSLARCSAARRRWR